MLKCLKERGQNEGHLAVTTTNIQVQIELKYIKICLHSIFRHIHIFSFVASASYTSSEMWKFSVQINRASDLS